jgi:serine/threonine-protein kinase
VAALATVGAGAAAVLGGEDAGEPTADRAATAGRAAATTRALAVTAEASTLPEAERPGAIAVAAGSVWVTGGRSTRIARFDARTGREQRPSARIPSGTRAITADGHQLWLVNEPQNELIAVDATTGRVRRRIDLLPGNPYAVDADRNAIWVGSRSSSRTPNHTVIRVDRRSGEQKAFVVERGVRSLAAGDDAVWVTPIRGTQVTRLDKRTATTELVRAGDEPKGVAVGAGAVWVANSGGSTVTQIDPRTRARITVDVGPAPQLVAVASGGVWVTVQNSSRLVRLERDATEPTAQVATAANPYAVAATGTEVWITSPPRSLVQRIALTARGA